MLEDTASKNQCSNLVDMAVSFGRCGMLGKACLTLLSSGIALNNQTTWQLLKAKNPTGHLPITPNIPTTLFHLTQPLILHQS